MSSSPLSPSPVEVRSSSRSGLRDSVLGTRNLMTVAALSVVGAIVLIPLNYITPIFAVSPDGILFMCALMGVWIVPFMLPAVIVNKPGVFMVTGLIIGVIGVFTTPYGAGAIVGNLIGAFLVAVPFPLTLYRVWNWPVFMVSGITFGGVNSYMYWSAYQIEGSVTQQVLAVTIAVATCWIGVAVCFGLKRVLQRAGVGIAQQQ